METEIWKSVVGYEGLYEVSNLGRVKSLLRFARDREGQRVIRERILKSSISPSGYQSVSLYNGGFINVVSIQET